MDVSSEYRRAVFSLTLHIADVDDFCAEAQRLFSVTLIDDIGNEINGKNMVTIKEILINSDDFCCLAVDSDEDTVYRFASRWRGR